MVKAYFWGHLDILSANGWHLHNFKTDMKTAKLRHFLTAQATQWSDPRLIFWYSLSLVFAIYYGYLFLQDVFISDYVVQDDARQHVFWMLRLWDNTLLPENYMADYYSSQAPWGYVTLYKGAIALGIHPFLFNKILPPIISLGITHYCFQLSLQILPVPATAFASTILLNQSLWMRDDLASGTARSFVYLLLPAFLVYLMRRSVIPCLITIILQPLFYPSLALISGGILIVQLMEFKAGKLHWSRDRRTHLLVGLGCCSLAILLIPYVLGESPFGPTVTPEIARTMPEFQAGGRTAYFLENPILFWFGDRSGFMPTPVLTPPLTALSLLFPVFWWRQKSHPWHPILRKNVGILRQLVGVSFGLFFTAHGLLFALYLPSRYTHHSLRLFFALTASFTLGWILDRCLQQLEIIQSSPSNSPSGWTIPGFWTALGLFLSFNLVGYSLVTQSFPSSQNRYGFLPELYQFFETTPKDTIIASLTKESSNLQFFSQRSLLVAPELGIPYQVGYYQQFRERVLALITAQYSPDPHVVEQLIQQYDVDYWLLDDQLLSVAGLQANRWLNQYQPELNRAVAHLSQDPKPWLLDTGKAQCTVLETVPTNNHPGLTIDPRDADHYWLLDAACLLSLVTPS